MRGRLTNPWRIVATLLVGALGALLPAGAVSAHTDLEFSLPTDGAMVGDPVSEIRIAFTLPVTLVGNGFEVLDPQGEIRQPFAVTDDDKLFRLQMDPPLAGGDVGVRWEVRAEDGHVLSGSFSFTVDSPPPTVAPATTAPPTVAPATTAPPTATVASSPAAQPTAVADEDTSAAIPLDTTEPPIEATSATSDASRNVNADQSSSSNTGIIIGALVVAVLAGGVLVLRQRTSTA